MQRSNIPLRCVWVIYKIDEWPRAAHQMGDTQQEGSIRRHLETLDGRVDLGDAAISMYLLIAITLDQDTAQSSYLVRMLDLVMTNTAITQLIVYMTRMPYTDLPEITLLELYLATKDLVHPKSRTQILFLWKRGC